MVSVPFGVLPALPIAQAGEGNALSADGRTAGAKGLRAFELMVACGLVLLSHLH